MAAQPGGMGILAVIMLSGGVALLLLGRHKLLHLTIQSNSSSSSPTLSSREKLLKKKKKKVHFAKELVECFGEKDDNREETEESRTRADYLMEERHPVREKKIIPGNRIALYNGMLRYRLNQASLYK